MSYVTYPNVQNVIDRVSQDIRQQLAASSGTSGQPILIDYTNRIHKQILRFSRWGFLLSEPQYFMTDYGQGNYWLGPKDAAPAGYVDTRLDLPDLDKIKKDSVVDISNVRNLKWLSAPPYGPTLNDRTGQGRPGRPATWVQNPNDPNQFQMYPPPANDNVSQPAPQTPVVFNSSGGALPSRMYFIKTTYVDQLGGESTANTTSAQRLIPANELATVKSPILPFDVANSGTKYNRYNVYACVGQQQPNGGQFVDPNTETLQNLTPINIGDNWQEPTTGLTITGAQVPNQNTLQQIGGFIIKFQYYKVRKTLTDVNDTLQVPEDYLDVIVHGVNAYAWELLGKKEEAQIANSLYQAGKTEMIADKNLFPEGVEFMRPDSASYVTAQILGVLPANF